jgi:hypothetical protein
LIQNQNFCGLENIETAQLYLADFEKLYRFTPFSDDAQPAIRGKCPLALAGYDISQMPMAALCQGLSLDWSLELTQNNAPNWSRLLDSVDPCKKVIV